MKGEKCELCGYLSRPGAIEEHHIVPIEITQEAGKPPSATVRLCVNCHQEIHTHYASKISALAYHPETKRFEPKPFSERVKEYQSIFETFRQNKEAITGKDRRPHHRYRKRSQTAPTKPQTSASSSKKETKSSSDSTRDNSQLRLYF